jgi:hypothetical protein
VIAAFGKSYHLAQILVLRYRLEGERTVATASPETTLAQYALQDALLPAHPTTFTQNLPLVHLSMTYIVTVSK